MQKTAQWKDQISFYRFFNNKKVTESGLIACTEDFCERQCRGLDHVLLIEDTTELNMEKHRGRITDKTNLGLVGNNKDLGFFCHPTIVVNPTDNSLIGAIDIHLWHRSEDKVTASRRSRSLKDKESYRWANRAIESKKRLPFVPRATVVQDREGDIYESFCLLEKAGLDFVVRSHHDRRIAEDGASKLQAHIQSLSPSYQYEIEVTSDNKKRKKRKALMEVRYGQVTLSRSASVVDKENYPASMSVYVVQVKEKPESVPKGEKPIEWTLYTSHEVKTPEQALIIVGYYKARWMIEDLFRAVKSEGVNYESSELETGKALRKLFVMALMAAIQILQLRQSRDGKTQQKPDLVFSEEQIQCMEDLLPRLEGKTEKQKNPHPKTNLAWATWVIARMGGWKGYSSQRPPGVITLHDGWGKFQSIFQGWEIAKDVYKR